MIIPPSGVRVWLATGTTDMRRGMNGLALQVQEALRRDPHVGDLYVFRGKRGDLPSVGALRACSIWRGCTDTEMVKTRRYAARACSCQPRRV